MDVLLRKEPLIRKAEERYRRFTEDEQARYDYEARQKFLHDQASYLGDAREEGRAEGITEGKIQAARRLKERGMSAEEIAEVTGLSPAQVQSL